MNSLIKFKAFVDEILAEAGRNYKISVLEKYKDDEDIKYLLDFIYNPYITTGLSDKKLNKQLTDICVMPYLNSDGFKLLLQYLKVNNTGTDRDIALVQDFKVRHFNYSYDTEPSNLCKLFDAIVTKNIQLGIDAKTINKVIPGLIPEFNVQLSNKYFDKPEIVNGKEFVITTKIDGSRIIAMKDNGKVSFWTRQGQKYEGLVDLEKELKESFPDNICLDGEIVAIDTDKENTYKNTMKLSRTKDLEKHGLKMLVFDCMTVEDFKNQKCDEPYFARRSNLITYFSRCFLEECVDRGFAFEKEYAAKNLDYLKPGNYDIYIRKFKEDQVNFVNAKHTYFKMLPILYEGNDTSKITEILEEQVSKGEEGIMINICKAPYHFCRTWDLLKVKLFKDCDLTITGFEEGTNKLVGTLGALILDYKGNELRCGSGFSDEQRAEIWANRDQYLGKIAEIKYFEETTNQTGGISLRFPIFKDIRTDKTEPNY